MNMFKEDLISKLMKNKYIRGVLYFSVYKPYRLFKRIKSFVSKDAFIIVDHVYERDEKTNKTLKKKDSFQIYICEWGKCKRMFSQIDWEEVERILNLLKEDSKRLLLSMDVGGGTSSIIIPKWAKKKLIYQLEKALEK